MFFYSNPYIIKFTTPEYGEPLNVIISGLSDPYILTERGMHDYAKYLLSLSGRNVELTEITQINWFL